MYINDTHIGFYLVAAILGLVVGQFIDWMNKRLPEYKKVFTREIINEFVKKIIVGKYNPETNSRDIKIEWRYQF